MSNDMQIRVVFPRDALRRLLEALFGLPEELCPVWYRVSERGPKRSIANRAAFINVACEKGIGFFLGAPVVTHNVLTAGVLCTYNAFFAGHTPSVRTILTALAAANPIFGFGCTEEEVDARNRIRTTVQGAECLTWVGRDTTKHIPGLYWLTLLSGRLAEQHGVPLSKVKEVALEYVDLGRDQHLFRFHARPENWKENDTVRKMLGSQPGLFDIEKIRPDFEKVKTYAQFLALPIN
jgi:hypothetical protein